MLPSESAIRMVGYCCSACRLSQSAAPTEIDIGMVVIHASIGVSIEACGAGFPAPMCRQIVMSCALIAFQKGSQYSLWMLGSPCTVGFSLIETVLQPLAAIRLISSKVAFM